MSHGMRPVQPSIEAYRWLSGTAITIRHGVPGTGAVVNVLGVFAPVSGPRDARVIARASAESA